MTAINDDDYGGDEKDGAKVRRHIFSASFLFFQANSCFPILNILNHNQVENIGFFIIHSNSHSVSA